MTNILGGIPSEGDATLYIYGYEYDPVCCPRCGIRTIFQDLDSLSLKMHDEKGLQLHRCLNKSCCFVFLAAEM